MITSLALKNVTSYDAINGILLNDLKKVNFFFGFNGSGKSTIGKYLNNLVLDAASQSSDFVDCSNVGFDNSRHQILTYNEEFIEENFKRNNVLKGVFSLNQSNAIIDQQIVDEDVSIANYEVVVGKYKNKLEVLDRDKKAKGDALLSHCWNQRATFATFLKITLAYSGSKPNHLQEIKRVLQNPLGQILSLQTLTENYQNLYEKDLGSINLNVDAKLYFEIRRLEITISKLLQEVIVGNEDVDILALIQSLNSRSWVETGLKFLEVTGEICPFCQQQTINADLREQFNKLFDETYKRKITELEALRDLYNRKCNLFIANILTIQNVFNPNNLVSNLVIVLKELVDDNIDIVQYKIEHSNEKKTLVSLSTIKNELSSISQAINDNNSLFQSSDLNKRNLLQEIWKFMAGKCEAEIKGYSNREVKYNKLNTLTNSLKTSNEQKIITSLQIIETLRNQTVNTTDAVDSINIILKNAGFEGFEISEMNRINNISRYYLKRYNSHNTNPVFNSLSEGEKSFIAFLYFYQLCLGTNDLQNNSSKKKIIIIDDPVSSLDSQALFIVSTLIHSLILRKANDNKPNRMQLKNTNIEQVFILTHNIYFYKEVSFSKRPICSDYWHYKVLKVNNQTKITGDYNRMVFDDYSLMWKTMKDIKSNIPPTSSLNIVVANSMRRIIESYVNFIGYGTDAWAALLNEDTTAPSYYIKCAFISTINDESHKIAVLDNAYYQKIINEQPNELFNAFASIFKSIGKEHYEIMMEETL